MKYDFPKRLVEIRKSLKYTQTEMANFLGIKRARYASYEEGRAFPIFTDLIEFAEKLGFKSIDGFLLIGEIKSKNHEGILGKYYRLSIQDRQIVDFILKRKK
jgi:transcriptional regulator with XRE-family HTH domain